MGQFSPQNIRQVFAAQQLSTSVSTSFDPGFYFVDFEVDPSQINNGVVLTVSDNNGNTLATTGPNSQASFGNDGTFLAPGLPVEGAVFQVGVASQNPVKFSVSGGTATYLNVRFQPTPTPGL